MKRSLWFLLGLCSSLVSAGEPEWRVREFAVEKTGQVWGIAAPADWSTSSRIEEINAIAKFDVVTSQWTACPSIAAPAGATPVSLTTLSNGKVVTLWSSPSKSVLTIEQDSGEKSWATIDATFHEPRLQPLSNGGLAITERGPMVALVSGEGQGTKLLRIPDTFFKKPSYDDERNQRSYVRVHAAECGDGSVWLWSYRLGPRNYDWRIDGLIRYAENQFTRINKPLSLTNTVASAVLADGTEHMLVSEVGKGLQRIHWPSGEQLQIEVGTPTENGTEQINQLQYVEQLAFVNGALHIVSCPRPDEIESLSTGLEDGSGRFLRRCYRNISERTGTLWRRNAEGQFIRLIDGLDDHPQFGWNDRPLLFTHEGLFVGSWKSPPWWVPAESEAKPYQLNFSTGYPLRSTERISNIGKQLFLTRSFDGAWAVSQIPSQAPEKKRLRLNTLHTHSFLIQDKDFQIWAFRKDHNDFAMWSGLDWTPFALPSTFSSNNMEVFALDSNNQGWVIPHDLIKTDGSMKPSVFNFSSKTWRTFYSMEDAVVEALTPGDSVRLHDEPWCSILSTYNGGKGYLDFHGVAHVFKNGIWTRSSMQTIAGPDARTSDTPYYDKQDRFVIPLNFRHYGLSQNGNWEELPETNRDEDSIFAYDNPPLPRECTIPHITSTTYDRHGVAWITTRSGGLWKYVGGVQVRLILDGRENPLAPEVTLKRVLIDTRGNAFLQYAQVDGIYDILFANPASEIHPAIISKQEDDAVTLDLQQSVHSWSRIRLDNTAWKPLTQQPTILITGLTPGNHTIEIESYDAELRLLDHPQQLSFSIQQSAENIILSELDLLRSANVEDREKSARKLKAQGVSALPVLKRTLEGIDPKSSLGWWVKAIIQHIESKGLLQDPDKIAH